ncbi:hypothetical protein [Neptunomonas sp.]|uniref:beta family protein n=1 Tax=Neptunomonas sp. TaxID=1971898 RepID=UPI0025F95096|nr:hypothetical protein [Neptunomonas sp.]
MNNYTPFLKFKTAEIGALKALKDAELEAVTPFFDLATRKDITDEDVKKTIIKGVRKYELNFKNSNGFYIDDFDIDDSMRINGSIVYEFLIQTFQEIDFIPVIGLDRTTQRINSVFNPLIISDTLAIRLNQEDFISYTLIEDELAELLERADSQYSKFHLLLDCRLCIDSGVVDLSTKLIQLIQAISSDHHFEKIIISGSSIHASVAEILPVSSEALITRKECNIFQMVTQELGDRFGFGDYTVISPNYSDADIPKSALRKVMTAKVIYSYEDKHHFLRGGAIETHPRGAKQYDDMCLTLTSYVFYRGKAYSVGDEYIDTKSNGIGVDALPHSIGKYLINAHMTFMINDY